MHPYLRKSLDYAGSDFINKLLYLLLLPLFTHFLPPAQYAIYANITIFMGFAGLLYLLGLQQALFSFYYEEKSPRHYRSVIITVLTAVTASGLLLSALIAINGTQISQLIVRTPNYGHIIRIVAVIIFFDSLFAIIRSLLNIMERSRSYGLLAIIKNGIFVCIVGFFALQRSLAIEQLFIALLVASVISFVLALVVIIRYTSAMDAGSVGFSGTLFLRMLGFGLVMIPGTVAMMALRVSDRYMITYLSPGGLHDAGIYAISYRVGSVVAFLNGIVSLTFFPYAMKIASEPFAKRSYTTLMNYYLLGGVVIASLVMLFSPELFSIFIDDAYAAAIPIVFCGVISTFLNGIFNIINLSFYIKKRAGNIAGTVFLGALINIGLNYFFIPRWGISGAAVASVIAYLFIVLFNFTIAEKMYPVGYSLRRILGAIALLCVIAWINPRLPQTLWFSGIKIGLVIAGSILIWMVSPSPKLLFNKIQENIRGSDLSS